LWILTLIVAASVFAGAYLPYRLWNDESMKTICATTGQITPIFCGGGILNTCFEAWAVTKANDFTCGSFIYAGVWATKQGAEQWLSRLKKTFVCFYIESDPCNPSSTLRDVKGAFIAGVVFVGLAFLFFAIWLGVKIYRHHQHKYEIIE